jgi:hypothetical protein
MIRPPSRRLSRHFALTARQWEARMPSLSRPVTVTLETEAVEAIGNH